MVTRLEGFAASVARERAYLLFFSLLEEVLEGGSTDLGCWVGLMGVCTIEGVGLIHIDNIDGEGLIHIDHIT
jgi:hypothetical protein